MMKTNFLKKCKSSKIDGLIVVDLPYPENKSFSKKCKRKGVNFVQFSVSNYIKYKIKKNYQRLS